MKAFEAEWESLSALSERLQSVAGEMDITAFVGAAMEARAAMLARVLGGGGDEERWGERVEMSIRLSREIDARLSRAVKRSIECRMEELADQARRDPLTGLANRAAFADRLREEAARARRYGRELSLAIFDVDRFKQVNDSLGHLAGDALLRKIAAALQSSLRRTDSVYRYGGDEFVAIYPETSGHTIATVLRRLENRLGAFAAPGARVGISWGAASIPVDTREEQELIRIADQRLYENKRRKQELAAGA
ncbi:MAG: GGDEF domain-containing protein [Blastocatellia bacterium]